MITIKRIFALPEYAGPNKLLYDNIHKQLVGFCQDEKSEL